MSKNVAVFVDVANIFYAAKAAGVDIDYVTLLSTLTAGRDFVRAYAYTGLDPENENQQRFHEFLRKSGYKVVSKDIRKYGDGKIKANLDIELVVDLMRTARNLDIAVVVSGDGDFAPAIRAVQQQGVRVEVVSFPGNTSKDLYDVADKFLDITKIARVDRDSARSGRRIAASAEDLSMTEVPDKETEGAPRRGRGGRGRSRVASVAPMEGGQRRAEAVVIEAPAGAGTLIVLPGERLSRAAGAAGPGIPVDPGVDEEDAAAESDLGLDLEAGDEVAGGDGAGTGIDEAAGEGARRRRRRRGGRGRGRGRGGEMVGEAEAGTPVVSGEGLDIDEDEDLPEVEVPRLPAASTFGSVWDSQLGVTPSPVMGTAAGADAGRALDADDVDDDEPEIPEYLLAERRQRGRGQGGRGPGGRPMGGQRGGGGRGRQGAYQAAIERERFGRSGTSAFSQPRPAGPREGGPREPGRGEAPRRDQGRPDSARGRDGRDQRGRGGQPQGPGVPRGQGRAPQPQGSDPWSEVPPELEEMLRAELARKQAGTPAGASSGNGTSLAPEDVTTVDEAYAPADDELPEPPLAVAAVAEARSAASDPEGGDGADAEARVGDEAAGTGEAPRSRRRTGAAAGRTRRTPRVEAAGEAGDLGGEAAPMPDAGTGTPEAPDLGATAEETPRRRTTRRRATSTAQTADAPEAEAAALTAPGDSATETATEAPRKRTTRRRTAPADAGTPEGADAGAGADVEGAARQDAAGAAEGTQDVAPSTPRRRTAASRSTGSASAATRTRRSRTADGGATDAASGDGATGTGGEGTTEG